MALAITYYISAKQSTSKTYPTENVEFKQDFFKSNDTYINDYGEEIEVI